MKTYRFTFTLEGETVCSNDMADAIYAVGGDDATVGSSDGSVRVHFDRDAKTLDEAIRSAAATLAKAGYRPAHVEIDDETLRLVTA